MTDDKNDQLSGDLLSKDEVKPQVVDGKVGVITDLESWKCGICAQGFDSDCRELECGHIFHRPCLEDLVKAKPLPSLKCPICRNSQPLPNGGQEPWERVKELKKSLIVRQVVEEAHPGCKKSVPIPATPPKKSSEDVKANKKRTGTIRRERTNSRHLVTIAAQARQIRSLNREVERLKSDNRNLSRSKKILVKKFEKAEEKHRRNERRRRRRLLQKSGNKNTSSKRQVRRSHWYQQVCRKSKRSSKRMKNRRR